MLTQVELLPLFIFVKLDYEGSISHSQFFFQCNLTSQPDTYVIYMGRKIDSSISDIFETKIIREFPTKTFEI